MGDDERADRPGDATPAPDEDLREPRFSWQGGPGYSAFDPERFPPHAPMPGAPPYPAGVEHEPPPVSQRRRDRALPRCLAAAAVWAAVAVVVAALTVAPGGWAPRALAIALPFLVTTAVLVPVARRGTGPWALVLVAGATFWVLHALAVTLLG